MSVIETSIHTTEEDSSKELTIPYIYPKQPSIPNAQSITKDAASFLNHLIDNKRDVQPDLFPIAPWSWPDMNLPDFILWHFWTLNEKLVKPIQNSMCAYFSGQIELLDDNCAVLTGAKPKSTTLLVSSFEFAVVFAIPSLNFTAIDKLLGGAFVVLLPDIKKSHNSSTAYEKMMTISKYAMMGKMIYSDSSTATSLVSILINASDMGRMLWSSTYTLFICDIAAVSTISTMSWLHDEYADLKRDRFSPVLTPRILAARNNLSDSQLTAWDKNLLVIVDKEDTPNYLLQAEIDVSCIMVKNEMRKARPGLNQWPSPTDNAYTVSSDQLEAIRFTMCHPVSIISGAPGTGKTFIASELALLMSQALEDKGHPVLVLTKTSDTLDIILNEIIKTIPGVVTFAGKSYHSELSSRRATH
ncbi:uncharacterized protein EV154DRAFT_600634 [Mucor mucedo]|uniref:uncharacterized protein n=1 Tax=Mucor mucedo TaxID=29922 RepID=UPI00221F5B4F|nr:uncharacterized protein EV154DRAFT_600634 [Mucor mucedo]KAI7893796.1 hypothetical protein EV154DRAFT_600634 [Mucor mucedo]